MCLFFLLRVLVSVFTFQHNSYDLKVVVTITVPPVVSKLKCKILHRQAWKPVYNVLSFMDSEATREEREIRKYGSY